MIGYIIVRWDGESYGQHSDPSVVYFDRDEVITEAARLESNDRWCSYTFWDVEVPEPPLPVPAPDGWAVVAEEDGQLALAEASA